jgi:Fe2+ or Zn2+ uptake regulation protein
MSGIQKRATQQLATVYKALQGDHSHPSADEIYQRVRQTLSRISLGRVYRNLQRLVEERKIRMLLLGERVARYDPVLAAHDHFICQQWWPSGGSASGAGAPGQFATTHRERLYRTHP